jgi:hypothetical protein
MLGQLVVAVETQRPRCEEPLPCGFGCALRKGLGFDGDQVLDVID